MSEKDMIDLIKAAQEFRKLNDRFIELNRCELSCDDYGSLYNIFEVIRRNSRFAKDTLYNDNMFGTIMLSDNNTPEDIYELLKRED